MRTWIGVLSWLIPVVVLSGVGIAFLLSQRSPLSTGNKIVRVRINGATVMSEVAETAKARNQGLSGRQSLAGGTGMLFLFPTPDRYGFWMRDMRFPLDFIWVNDGKVVETSENIPPAPDGQEPPVYRPKSPVTAVLEVPAGFVQRHGVRSGDRIAW